MDSFAEPHNRAEHSLKDVRAQVARLEAEHKAKGIPLTGRIIHVCHYLPVTCALSESTLPPSSRNAIPSPPQTPPAKPADIDTVPSPIVANEEPAENNAPPGVNAIHETQERFHTASTGSSATHDAKGSRWQLATRYGHSAMVSGIASLCTTHEQVFVGWTGDVYAGPVRANQEEHSKLASGDVGPEERKQLEVILGDLELDKVKESENRHKLSYVPVWLDDKIAHGHYDGYCKQSECLSKRSSVPRRLQRLPTPSHPLHFTSPLPSASSVNHIQSLTASTPFIFTLSCSFISPGLNCPFNRRVVTPRVNWTVFSSFHSSFCSSFSSLIPTSSRFSRYRYSAVVLSAVSPSLAFSLRLLGRGFVHTLKRRRAALDRSIFAFS